MIVTQNAVRPGVRPYLPPKMAEGDLMIYQTNVQQFTIKTPPMSEVEYNVFIYNGIYILHIQK